MNAFEAPKLETVQLEKLRIAVKSCISQEALDSYVDSYLVENMAYEMVVVLRAHVWGKEKTQHIAYPATWWDAFKLRWFPARALERWPAQETHIHVTARAWFPDLRVSQSSSNLRLYFSADAHYDTAFYRPNERQEEE